MRRFCIADDYFKALDEIMDLKTVIEKKDEEIYALKHELAKTQTNLSHIKHNIPANNKKTEPEAEEPQNVEKENE